MGLRPDPKKVEWFFLWRRPIDAWALTTAIALLPFFREISAVIIGIFCGVGIYLIAVRHRSARRVDPLYVKAAAVLAAVALAIGLLHGNLVAEMRWISYPLYFLAASVLFAGWVLVRNPLRQVVLGTRIAIILGLCVAAYEFAFVAQRIGFGTNPANTAFTLALLGIVSRIDAGAAPRWLPNGTGYFYLAAIPALLTGTRAVMIGYAVIVAIDGIAFLLGRNGLREAGRGPVVAASALAILAGGVFFAGEPIAKRTGETVEDIEALVTQGRLATVSMNHRQMLWTGAAGVIGGHWLIGMGGEASMAAIKAGAQRPAELEPYTHVHNAVLDELRVRGVIGLVAYAGFFAVVFWQIFRCAPPGLKRNAAYLLVLFAAYGAMHGLLVSDGNVSAIAIVLVAMTDYLRKTAAIPGGHAYAVALKPHAPPHRAPAIAGVRHGR